jgi:hypothetical protein
VRRESTGPASTEARNRSSYTNVRIHKRLPLLGVRVIADIGWGNWIVIGFLVGLGFHLASAVVGMAKSLGNR